MTATTAVRIRRGYADAAAGSIHYAECGAGAPVVLLHQTPRSWDEFREVLPRLGATHRAIAPDTPGFGNSIPLDGSVAEHSIEAYAAGVLALLDALGLDRVDVVGHHTGGVVATEVAAHAPERVRRLVLTSTPYVDAEWRERRRGRPAIDAVDVRADGAHLTELWNRRAGFYPVDRPDLLTRFVRDALALDEDQLEAGHEAVARYRMEERAPLVTAPVLCVGASDDPHAFPEIERLNTQLTDSRVRVIRGGMVPLMEQRPDEIVELIAGFLS